MHWQREHDLADAEAGLAGLEAATDWYGSIVSGLGARRDKVTAENRAAEARAQQRVVVQAAAASANDSRRRVGVSSRPSRRCPRDTQREARHRQRS
jgi:hypothetical protein